MPEKLPEKHTIKYRGGAFTVFKILDTPYWRVTSKEVPTQTFKMRDDMLLAMMAGDNVFDR